MAVPKWAQPADLFTQLQNQELMDPEDVFGPIGSLDMEAVFPDTGEGSIRSSKTFTPSPAWDSADMLTSAEIAADYEARLRMMRLGGWVYQGALL